MNPMGKYAQGWRDHEELKKVNHLIQLGEGIIYYFRRGLPELYKRQLELKANKPRKDHHE